jgi:hypothetical protein
MRRAAAASIAALVGLLLVAATAQAAAPTLTPVSATDIQGVSALVKGKVDPEGLSTTYYFEYGLQANFAGAVKTPTAEAGSGTDAAPARAAISGLSPSTTYHLRLVASNSSGTTTGTASTFQTTAGFGFLPGTEGFAVSAPPDGGAAVAPAGSHPYQLSFGIGLKLGGEFEDQPGVPFSDGDLRDLHIEGPAGLIENPNALAKCTLADFHTARISPFEESHSGESCPTRTQVGTVEVQTSLGGGQVRRFGLFNLDPKPGIPAQLGFAPFGAPITIDTDLHAGIDGSYTLGLNINDVPQSLDLYGLNLVLWGAPWAASHNGERGNCLNEVEPEFPWAKCSVGEPRANAPLAFLTLPHRCSGQLLFNARADSWQQGGEVSAEAVNRDSLGQPIEMGSCNGFNFAPRPVGLLTDTKASSASGYNFRLEVDNEGLTDPEQRAPAPTRKAVVSLPGGVTINPSVGAGLGVCTPAQYAAETPTSPQGAGCPNASKLGDFLVRSPLFEKLLNGAIYLAQPDNPATAAPGAENPFDSLIVIYLVAKLPERGVMVKLPGRIVPDPASGNLTAIFDGLPQLPYSDLNLTFRTGQRALLVTPPACGPANTQIDLTPWAGSLSVHTTTSSPIETGIGGGPCPSGPLPYAPVVSAGGVNSNVNSYTPYFVHISRQDTEQEITSYSLVLPKGITGKLAGIPFCPDAAIAAARGKRGSVEAASPSCPAASEVGHTLSGYGVGNSLTYATGRIYLAGPYHGQPLSLVAINPATVGPFDLGNIVIRSAFAVDEHTAQLHIDPGASDPIPHILDGIPVHLRDVRIYMDRHEFTHNPSSCAPGELVSNLGGSGALFGNSSDDTIATATQHFQLLNCLTLDFKPHLGIRLRGGVGRGAYPSLRATFAARGPGDSNLKEIAVNLPHSQFLAQNHIRQICTRVQFAADSCPPDSVYGSAVAYTPLFDEPLRGDVYLRSSSHKLPDLVASLHSGAIHIVLEGKIGPTRQGGIRALFSDLPDEPLDRFVMKLNGGKRGLLTNSSNICKVPPLATVRALAQNNLGRIFTTKLRGQCGKKKRKPDTQHERGNR